LKIGVVQPHFLGWKNPESINQAKRLLARFENKQVDLIVLPEMYPGICEPLRECAKSLKSHLVVGEIIRQSDGLLRNSVALVSSEGDILGRYFKRHLMPGEKKVGYSPGNEINVFDTRIGRIGIEICYDFPIAPELTTIITLKGADILVVPSMASKSLLDYWRLFLVSRSVDNGIPIIFANIADQFLENNYVYGGGRSKVIVPAARGVSSLEDFLLSKEITPRNNIILEMGEKEGTATVEIDVDAYKKYRNDMLNERSEIHEMSSYLRE
jgi:predicted amidohydrolase